MPYLLKNLMATRKEPVRRGGQKHHLLRRYKLRIGSKTLGPARKIKVSDAFYEANKKWIEQYQELGALEVQELLGSLNGEELEAAKARMSGHEDKAAPEKIEARETPKLDAPEEKPTEEPKAEEPKEEAKAEEPKKAPAKRRGRKKKEEGAE